MYVKFFCRTRQIKTFNGKPVYEAFPRPDGSTTTAAEKWASFNGSPPKVILTENEFSEVYVGETLSHRGQNGIVPHALIFNEDEDAYIKIDFRMDGLLNVIQSFGVVNGKVLGNMGLTFSSSSYKLHPINSKEFTEYKDSLDDTKEEKPSLASQGYSSKVEVGKMYVDKNGNRLNYMGQFERIECDPHEEGKYHVYITKRSMGYCFTIVKSKIMVKEVLDSSNVYGELPKDVIFSRFGTLSGYGFRNALLNLTKQTIAVIE